MWTCRRCLTENPDEHKTCSSCGEKNLNPPMGAEVKRVQRKSQSDETLLLTFSAWMVAVVGAVGVIVALITLRPLIAVCITVGTVPLYAILRGMATIIRKL